MNPTEVNLREFDTSKLEPFRFDCDENEFPRIVNAYGTIGTCVGWLMVDNAFSVAIRYDHSSEILIYPEHYKRDHRPFLYKCQPQTPSSPSSPSTAPAPSVAAPATPPTGAPQVELNPAWVLQLQHREQYLLNQLANWNTPQGRDVALDLHLLFKTVLALVTPTAGTSSSAPTPKPSGSASND